MKALICTVVFGLLGFVAIHAQIHSTPAGGNWSSNSTWVGNVVPTTNDDVEIHGNVFVVLSVYCRDLTIDVGTGVRNVANSNGNLYISGSLYNSGTLEDNPGGIFSIYVSGDIFNHGSIGNKYLYLQSASVQSIYQAETATPFNNTYFISNNATSALQMLSDLRFTNSQINLQSRHLIMYQGRTIYNLNFNGGKLQSAYLDTQGYPTLELSNGAFLHNVTAQDITLEGTVNIYFDVYLANVINNSILQNNAGANTTLTINGNLDNCGAVQNNTGSTTFGVSIGGNLSNYGTFTNNRITFTATSDQSIYQGAAATPFQVNYINKSSGSGNLIMLSDLSFTNSQIDLLYASFKMYSGGYSRNMTLAGGHLYRTNLNTDGFSTLNMSEGAYLYYVNAQDLILQGTMMPYFEVYFDDVVSYATIMNIGVGSTNFVCNGNFTNYGTVQNNSPALLTVYCRKNVANYGTINNYMFYVDGAQNQYLLLLGTITPAYFRLLSNAGNAAWYFNGTWISDGSDFKDIGPYYTYGVWQPHTINGWGRLITVGGGEPVTTPTNLSISYLDEQLLLTWDQVSGATYYQVYAAEQTEGPFVPLPDLVFDPDLSDSIVEIRMPPAATHGFYRITAAN